jgi:hypothetical protein
MSAGSWPRPEAADRHDSSHISRFQRALDRSNAQVRPANPALLAFPPVATTLSCFGKVSDIFVWFINGPEALAQSGRNMDATWRKTSTLCRELDWSRRRLIHELQNGLPYRTIPPGHTIDWHDPNVVDSLDVEASEVSFYHEKLAREQSYSGPGLVILGLVLVTVGIEVLPPTDAPAAAPSPPSPVAASSSLPTSPRKNVSEAELRNCILTIKAERPNDPPDEEELWMEVERRLNATVSRERIRQVRDDVAPEFKLPVGRPRKSTQ